MQAQAKGTSREGGRIGGRAFGRSSTSASASPPPSVTLNDLYHLYGLYLRADFAQVFALVNDALAREEDDTMRMPLLALRMLANVASGNGTAAYNDMMRAASLCARGLAQDEHSRVYRASVLCAMRIESLLMAEVFHVPTMRNSVDDLPLRLKIFFGYLLAMREIRLRHVQRAEGIAYAFTKIAGREFPQVEISLQLVMAATSLMCNNEDDATSFFARAQRQSEATGFVMPVVELHSLLAGLPRTCEAMRTGPYTKQVQSLSRRFHKGWLDLLRCCGLINTGYALTPLELHSVLLVGYGWRNKEIARHLCVTENTVKHQLSSAYHKMGARGRKEAADLVLGTLYGAELSLRA